jgi:hypothetical protein
LNFNNLFNKVLNKVFNKGLNEGLSNMGNFPNSVDKVILNDYPQIGKNTTSNKNYSDIWWNFPIFSLGSYEQITNNLKYRYNPDDGTCVRADFCDAMYYNSNDTKTNIITPLCEAQEGNGARVGYFRSLPNILYYSIPTNENILY